MQCLGHFTLGFFPGCEEGGHHFGGFRGAPAFDEAFDAGLDGAGGGEGFPVLHEAFLQADGAGAAGEDVGCDGFDGGIEGGQGDDFLDEAPAQGFGGAEDFAGEQDAPCGPPADELGEEGGFDDAGDADARFGHAEAGAFGSDAHVAGRGDFEAAAEGVAVHAGDDGGGAGADGDADEVKVLDQGAGGEGGEGGHFVDVDAADEGFFAGAGEDDGAQRGVGGDVAEGGDQGVHRGGVDDVDFAGVVDGDAGDGAALAGFGGGGDGGGHRRFLLGSLDGEHCGGESVCKPEGS